jgi:hypothetical protein
VPFSYYYDDDDDDDDDDDEYFGVLGTTAEGIPTPHNNPHTLRLNSKRKNRKFCVFG